MKWCSSYRQVAAHVNDCAQFRYPITAFSLALELMEEHPDKQAIIEVPDLATANLNIEKIWKLVKENPNLYFDFYKLEDYTHAAREAESRNYYFHYPLATYNAINYVLSMPGAAGITVMEPLTFEIQKVRDSVDTYAEGLCIRMVPYIARPTEYNAIADLDNGITHFWVLPQHINLYDAYVDYVDIIAGSIDRETALLNVYLQGSYILRLDAIFSNINTDMIGNFVDDAWASRRLLCHQTCMQHGWRGCDFCKRQESIYSLLKSMSGEIQSQP